MKGQRQRQRKRQRQEGGSTSFLYLSIWGFWEGSFRGAGGADGRYAHCSCRPHTLDGRHDETCGSPGASTSSRKENARPGIMLYTKESHRT